MVDKAVLKDSLLTAIEVYNEIKKETGMLFSSEEVAKSALAIYIQTARQNGNGHNGNGDGNGNGNSKPISIKQRIMLENLIRKRLNLKGNEAEHYLRDKLHIPNDGKLETALSRDASSLISD